MLGRALVSFLSKNRAAAAAARRRQSSSQQQQQSSEAAGGTEAPAATATKKRSRRDYESEEEEEEEWGMVEEHVPFHLASSSSASSASASASAPAPASAVSTRAPTPYRPAPEPRAAAAAAGEEEMDAELVFDRKVMEILEATEKAAAAQQAGRARGRVEDGGEVIVLPPLLKRHKPAPCTDGGMLYLGALDAATSTNPPPDVFVSFDDIFQDGNSRAEKDEEDSTGSTHSSPLFPRPASRPASSAAAAATTMITDDDDEERPSSSASSVSMANAATTTTGDQAPQPGPGVEWSNAWAAALGLPPPSAFVFKGTLGHKALAAPALFPSWAEQEQEEQEAAAAQQGKKKEEEDDEDDYLFGKPKPASPPQVRPRAATEPSIWERAEPLVDCTLSLGPEGCRTRAGPTAAAAAAGGAASWGMEDTDLAWDTGDLHSVTLYHGLECLGGRALLVVAKPSLRPPWCSPRLDVVALPVEPAEGRNAAGLEALAAFLAAETAKRAAGCSSSGGGGSSSNNMLGGSWSSSSSSSSSSNSVPVLHARALLAAKVRVVPAGEAHTRPELPHLVELVGGFGKGKGSAGAEGAKAKRD